MSDELPEVDADALDHVTEVSLSSGRKRQLEQYEPINEQATLTLEFPDGASNEEKAAAIEAAQQAARDQCERGLMRRYEEHIREDVLSE